MGDVILYRGDAIAVWCKNAGGLVHTKALDDLRPLFSATLGEMDDLVVGYVLGHSQVPWPHRLGAAPKGTR